MRLRLLAAFVVALAVFGGARTAVSGQTPCPVTVCPDPDTLSFEFVALCELCSTVDFEFSGAPLRVVDPRLGLRETPLTLLVQRGGNFSVRAASSVTIRGMDLRFDRWIDKADGRTAGSNEELTVFGVTESEQFAAVYQVVPGSRVYTHLRIHAVRVADTDGAHRARITPAEVRTWVENANRVFEPASIRFHFDPDVDGPDWSDVNDLLINILGDEDHMFGSTANATAEANKHPGKVVVFFRWGRGETPSGGGFSGADLNFVVMPGFRDTSACLRQNIGLFAHEVGHYFGLSHTHAREFKTLTAAAKFLQDNGGRASVFDGDGLSDTPPDPFIEPLACGPTPLIVTLNRTMFPLPRTNVMSYYHWQMAIPTEVRTLTSQQLARVQVLLAQRFGLP